MDADLTPRELAAIVEAKHWLRSGYPDVAVHTLVAATTLDDPPIAAGLSMPTWNAGSGMWPVVASGPLLELLEDSHA